MPAAITVLSAGDIAAEEESGVEIALAGCVPACLISIFLSQKLNFWFSLR